MNRDMLFVPNIMYSSSELLMRISDQLRAVYSTQEEALTVSQWILEYILDVSRIQLYRLPKIILSNDQCIKLQSILYDHITSGKPLAYCIGSVPFGDLTLRVAPPLLIPRPETEAWTQELIQILARAQQPLSILDLCTGTGCIGLSIAHTLPSSIITLTDINPYAIEYAQLNARTNNITNATYYIGDLFNALPSGSNFNCIVSNPPYIDPAYRTRMDTSVTQWEDPHALFADNYGLEIIMSIIKTAPEYIKNSHHTRYPQLTLEIDSTQGAAVVKYLEKIGYYNITLHKDMYGHDRYIYAHILT